MDDSLEFALLERYVEKELQVMMVIEIAQLVIIANYRITLLGYIHVHKENISQQKVLHRQKLTVKHVQPVNIVLLEPFHLKIVSLDFIVMLEPNMRLKSLVLITNGQLPIQQQRLAALIVPMVINV